MDSKYDMLSLNHTDLNPYTVQYVCTDSVHNSIVQYQHLHLKLLVMRNQCNLDTDFTLNLTFTLTKMSQLRLQWIQHTAFNGLRYQFYLPTGVQSSV